MNHINRELSDRVFAMRDHFAIILDEQGEMMNGALRIKMAKAELVLNRIGILIEEELQESDIKD